MVFSFFASVADELHSACAMFIVQLVPCLILADSKVLFRHRVSGLRTQHFLAFLSLDLDGV